MINVGFFQSLSGLLPAGVIMSYPIWLFEIKQGVANIPTTAIETQGWLLAIVGAAMGLVKIALWLRNYKEQKEGPETTTIGLQNIEILFTSSLENLKLIVGKLTENDERLSLNQQKLADNQMKALENHAKLSEALTLLRMQLQSMEQNLTSLQEKRTIAAIAEVKDIIREIRISK